MFLTTELRDQVVQGLSHDGWPEDRAHALVNNFEACATAVRTAGMAGDDTVEVSVEALFSAVYAFGQVLGIEMKLNPTEA